ncbi:MAG: tetratricopeptide repeat protein [Planctomycetota bacterium]|nr:tetratricopeptide repeat protein [Planctomycetota bacterium]
MHETTPNPSPTADRAGSAFSGPTPASPAGPRSAWVWLGLTLLVCVAYIPTFTAGVIWDDDNYVTNNPNLRDTAGLVRTWKEPYSLPQYYPLVHTSYWLEYHLWGLNPAGYHAVNILLHALNAFLFWLVLRRLRLPGSLAAAILFAVHPIEVESVAWITERKNTLSLALALGAVLAYLRFDDLAAGEADGGLPATPDAPPPARRWGWYPLSLLLFTGALLSKTVTATVAGVLLVLIWWKRGRVRLIDLLVVAPFWVIGGGFGWNTAHLEQVRVGAAGRDWAIAPIDRVLIAGRAVVFYASKILFPYELTFIYPRWKIDSGAAWQYLFPLAVVAVVLALWLARHRIGRGPLAAVLCFIGMLFPALGFFNVYPMRYSWVADHFQYLGGLALIALLAGAGATLWATLPETLRRPGPPLAAAVVLALAATTFLQCVPYRDAVTLWEDTIAKNEDATIAYFNLGDLASQAGRHDEAISLMASAVKARPDDPVAWANYASILDRAKKYGLAIDACRHAISLYSKSEPERGGHHYGLARTLGKSGRLAEAVPEFYAALNDGFTAPEVYDGLGMTLMSLGREAEAVRPFQAGVDLNPSSYGAHFNLASALAGAGRTAEAKAEAMRAADLAAAQGQAGMAKAIREQAAKFTQEAAPATRNSPAP